MFKIISSKFIETFLQKRRFNKILPYITGKSVFDYGGNRGELQKFLNPFVRYEYTNDPNFHTINRFDHITCLAVIEHMHYHNAFPVFGKFRKMLNKNGNVIITTPHIWAHPLLDILSWVGITDRANIEEHKFYWNKKSLMELAVGTGFEMEQYMRFQFGLNQLAVFKKGER